MPKRLRPAFFANRARASQLALVLSLVGGGMILQLGLADGERPVIIYPKPDHEPAGFTVLNFPVRDLDATVDALIARGIELVRYDGFEHDERGIAGGGEAEGPRIAWFTDPAGNILAVLEDPEAA